MFIVQYGYLLYVKDPKILVLYDEIINLNLEKAELFLKVLDIRQCVIETNLSPFNHKRCFSTVNIRQNPNHRMWSSLRIVSSRYSSFRFLSLTGHELTILREFVWIAVF